MTEHIIDEVWLCSRRAGQYLRFRARVLERAQGGLATVQKYSAEVQWWRRQAKWPWPGNIQDNAADPRQRPITSHRWWNYCFHPGISPVEILQGPPIAPYSCESPSCSRHTECPTWEPFVMSIPRHNDSIPSWPRLYWPSSHCTGQLLCRKRMFFHSSKIVLSLIVWLVGSLKIQIWPITYHTGTILAHLVMRKIDYENQLTVPT